MSQSLTIFLDISFLRRHVILNLNYCQHSTCQLQTILFFTIYYDLIINNELQKSFFNFLKILTEETRLTALSADINDMVSNLKLLFLNLRVNHDPTKSIMFYHYFKLNSSETTEFTNFTFGTIYHHTKIS